MTIRTFDSIEFQWCPSGTFFMGNPQQTARGRPDELYHEVTISEGFWLGKYEVTQTQWKAVMGSNPSIHKRNGKPMENVSWHDVQDFIAAMNAGKGVAPEYRLPTESEWEYACRAGTTTRFYWGNDPAESAIDDYAWYSDNSNSKPHVVGKKMPNAWGLYDTSGNIWEWCQDWYGFMYPAGPVTDPQGPATGAVRINRGGAYQSDPVQCRSAYRGNLNPDLPSGDTGFRLLRKAD